MSQKKWARAKSFRAAAAIRARQDRQSEKLRALRLQVLALSAVVKTINEDNQRLIVMLEALIPTIPERSEETP